MREPSARAPIFLRAPAMPVGIARELHGRCVGEKLALARHGRLDQVAEKHTDVTDHVESQADQGEWVEALAVIIIVAGSQANVAATHRAPEDDPAGQADHQDAEEHAHQPDVEPHVAVQDVAELVCDHPLQLVAREPLEACPK